MNLTEDQLQKQQNFRAGYARDHENAKGFDPIHLAAQLSRIRPDLNGYQVALDVAELAKLSRQLQLLAVHACNVGLSAGQETRQRKLATRVQYIASFYGLNGITGGDPRGCVVKLEGPGLRDNSFGGGFGIG